MNTSYAEQKWKASEAKVKFAQQFPKLLYKKDLSKKPNQVIKLRHSDLIIYDDTSFTFDPFDEKDVPKFMSNLRESKPYLFDNHKDAFEKLEALTKTDKEFTRLSRLEKLLGAVVNNSIMFPELVEAIPKCLAHPELNVSTHLPDPPNVKTIRLLQAIVDNLSVLPELTVEIPKVLNGTSTIVQCEMFKVKYQSGTTN